MVICKAHRVICMHVCVRMRVGEAAAADRSACCAAAPYSAGRPLRCSAAELRGSHRLLCNSAMACSRGAYGAEAAPGLSVSLRSLADRWSPNRHVL